VSRPAGELVRALPRELSRQVLRGEKRPEHIGRHQEYYDERAPFYPEADATTLEFASNGSGRTEPRLARVSPA
jgi:hypothetical protein